MERAFLATKYAILTFHEFLAKKAMVLPNLFRIEPFIGLAQPIPLKKLTPKRSVRLEDSRSKMPPTLLPLAYLKALTAQMP